MPNYIEHFNLNTSKISLFNKNINMKVNKNIIFTT